MNCLDAILNRRSVRKFQNQAVPDELLEKLLRAAMQAPSARNQQPWHFVVIDDVKILAEIAQEMPTAAMARLAPVGILICADLRLEKSPGYWVVDCAAAAENMLLAAHDLGLGAVWCGVYPREERMAFMTRLAKLPQDVRAHSLIVVGYPAEQPLPENRFQPDRVHRNCW